MRISLNSRNKRMGTFAESLYIRTDFKSTMASSKTMKSLKISSS